MTPKCIFGILARKLLLLLHTNQKVLFYTEFSKIDAKIRILINHLKNIADFSAKIASKSIIELKKTKKSKKLKILNFSFLIEK